MILERADDLRDRTPHDAHDLAFHPSARFALRRHLHEHDIAVHRTLQIIRTQLHIRMFLIFRQSRIANPFRMGLDAPSQ